MMKTTEIVAEQLIIGLLFITIVIIFIYGDCIPLINTNADAFDKFIFSVLVVAGAYAAGIVVDRCADTVLQDLEKHHRLREAVSELSYGDVEDLKIKNEDPFPEDRMRLKILKKGGSLADYHDYLRSRMRITRAIACLLPALFMALLLLRLGVSEYVRNLFGVITAFLYLGVLIWISTDKKNRPPKTHEFKKVKDYVDKRKPKGAEDKDKIKEKELKGFMQDILGPPTYGLVLFTILGLAIAGYYKYKFDSDILSVLYPLGGLFFAVLVGWVWWRISQTFFTFFRDFNKHILNKQPSES
jgi:hypothetical protein